MNWKLSRSLIAASLGAIASAAFAQAEPAQPVPAPAEPMPNVQTQPGSSQPPVTQPPSTQPASPQVTPTAPPVEPTPKPVAKKKGPVDSLKPGQFVWEKRDAYKNALRMVAVLDIQRMYVFDGDELVGFTTISTGKKGKETPTGAFKILQKKIYHESNLYANAPMPFMQRLTWDGIALHAGHNPGYPASHGCIRLPKVFAKALYDATQLEGEVVILASLDRPKPKPQPAPPPDTDTQPIPTPPSDPSQPVQPEPTPTPV